MRVVEITAPDTFDLRRRVLRDDDADADVSLAEDDVEGTVHLGALDADGRVVGVSTWIPTDDGIRLRGMAVEPAVAATGIGTRLLDAGTGRARDDGARRVWADARVTALGFYERHGWAASGPVFVTPATGLPHRRVVLDLD